MQNYTKGDILDLSAAIDKEFRKVFPESWIRISHPSLGTQYDHNIIQFTLLNGEDYPNGIMNNDPCGHMFSFGEVDGVLELQKDRGTISTVPEEGSY